MNMLSILYANTRISKRKHKRYPSEITPKNSCYTEQNITGHVSVEEWKKFKMSSLTKLKGRNFFGVEGIRKGHSSRLEWGEAHNNPAVEPLKLTR